MPRQRSIEIAVEPHEVVLGTPSIEVRAQSPLDDETAKGALALKSSHGTVSLSRDQKVATFVPDDGLPPGLETLVIEELVSTRGKRLSERVEVPFFVSDSRASVDRRLRVESIVRLRVERLGTVRLSAAQRPSGKFIEIMKAVDRKTGEPVELAFDQDGAKVDKDEIFDGIRQNRHEAFGKLHPALKEAVDRAGAGERIPVAIWFRAGEEPLYDKRDKGQTRRPPRSEQEHAKRISEAAARVAEMVKEQGGGYEPRPDPDAPVVFAELPAEGIRRLEGRDEIAAIFLHEPEGEVDLSSSMAIAQSDIVHSSLSVTGSGVNVAVYEDGPDVTTDLSITARYTSSPTTDDHSRHTHGIIKNIEANKPHGHAKDCNLHSANDMDLDAIRWAARTRAAQSSARASTATRSRRARASRSTTCTRTGSHCTGRTRRSSRRPATAKHGVRQPQGLQQAHRRQPRRLGRRDVRHSVFRNPASAHSDRELPEIAANGTAVTCVKLTKSGTSMAAPAAAGAAALLQQTNSTLKSWPEGCRAILLAAASKNVTGNTWWPDRSASVDASDGAGAVDALEGVRIAKSRRSPGAAGTRRGWDVGTLRSSDIGANRETTFSYQVTVPVFFFGPKVKVALAWDSNATLTDLLFLQIATRQPRRSTST